MTITLYQGLRKHHCMALDTYNAMLTKLSEQFWPALFYVVAGFANKVNTKPETITNAVDFTDDLHHAPNDDITGDFLMPNIQGAPIKNNHLEKNSLSQLLYFFTKFTGFTQEDAGHICSKFRYDTCYGLEITTIWT